MNNVEQKTQEELRSEMLSREALRLVRTEKTGDDLLDFALDGRSRTVENIVKLWQIVARSYSASMSLQAGSVKDGWGRYWDFCSEFLIDSGWTAEQLRELRYPTPPSVPVISDEDLRFVTAAMDRVTCAKLFDETKMGLVPANKTWGTPYAVEVLNVALHGETLNESSADRLWKAIQYYQPGKELPAAARAIEMCLCKVANTQEWDLLDPEGLSLSGMFRRS